MLRIGEALSFIGRETLRIVLPSWCVVCRAELPWRDRSMSCCGPCWRALPHIRGPKCRTCALPLPGDSDGLRCISCSHEDEQPLDWCEAWGEYRDGLEAVIHAFKFERHEFFDRPLAALMATTLRDRAFDAVVPVPMHRSKKRRRGYNQAELLAAALGEVLGIPMLPLAEKTKEKRTQSKLPRAERAENVRNTFGANAGAAGKAVLLVDDVCTTGETLRACARKLITAGAARVCAVTVAKAV